jgi:hypothetical protein
VLGDVGNQRSTVTHSARRHGATVMLKPELDDEDGLNGFHAMPRVPEAPAVRLMDPFQTSPFRLA